MASHLYQLRGLEFPVYSECVCRGRLQLALGPVLKSHPRRSRVVVTTRQPVAMSSSSATLPESSHPSVMTVPWFPTPRELTAPGRLHAQPLSQGLYKQRSI